MKCMKLTPLFVAAFWGVFVITIFTACGNKAPKEAAAQPSDNQHNTLTAAEKQEGWILLFDGTTLNGWRNFNKQTIGSSWKVEDGTLLLDAQKDPNGHWQSADGGDITAGGVFADFELRLDWKIDTCGNSGIIYRAVEAEKYNDPWQTGPEMQILDNKCHADANIEKHRAGDFYDVVACSQETVKPALEWNEARVVAKGNHIEHWLNGVKVVEVEMGTAAWKQLLAASKWKDHPDFSLSPQGLVVLQDHGNRVWFRNIKIKKL